MFWEKADLAMCSCGAAITNIKCIVNIITVIILMWTIIIHVIKNDIITIVHATRSSFYHW